MRQMVNSITVRALAAVATAVVLIGVMAHFTGTAVFADDSEEQQNNVIDYDMKPGETYDCTGAYWNTSVYIRKPGNYTIKGKSNNVMVMIESAGVNLYLADGLNLNCGATSAVGARASAINIGLDNGEPKGTVKIISKRNAKAYLEGYMAPAIQKNGDTTELVFETENPNSPGTITAKGGVLSAAIGGVCYAIPTSKTTGRMVFNSGNIVATAGSDSAAIGGGSFGGVCDLTFNGGNIKAYGSGWGAAIGGGKAGDVDSITINGGTIYAETDTSTPNNAAAIGSGGEDDYEEFNLVGQITINGGNITAKGTGTGIGAGGDECDLKHLTITGGTVNAQGAQPGAPGLGAAGPGAVEDITINGGWVNASGGIGAPGIGVWENSGRKGFGPAAAINVTINGGTVKASKGEYRGHGVNLDIGGQGSVANVRINGGTLLADSVQNAKNAEGDELHRVDISFDGFSTDGSAVTDAVFSDENMNYGTYNVCTSNAGKVFFWLPAISDTSLDCLTVNNTKYKGAISLSDSQGTMQPDNNSNQEGNKQLYTVYRLKNEGWFVVRLKVHDNTFGIDYYSPGIAIGEETELKIPEHSDNDVHTLYTVMLQINNIIWFDWPASSREIQINENDIFPHIGVTYTTVGTLFDGTFSWQYLGMSDIGNDELKQAATIKASKSKVKKGKKATVKVTSNSGAKLTAKANNSKAKKAIKKKYVKIKAGKTTKITFGKKVPKGKYTFKVTSPETETYKKTVKTITINVK